MLAEPLFPSLKSASLHTIPTLLLLSNKISFTMSSLYRRYELLVLLSFAFVVLHYQIKRVRENVL